jgi:hypothetical protein
MTRDRRLSTLGAKDANWIETLGFKGEGLRAKKFVAVLWDLGFQGQGCNPSPRSLLSLNRKFDLLDSRITSLSLKRKFGFLDSRITSQSSNRKIDLLDLRITSLSLKQKFGLLDSRITSQSSNWKFNLLDSRIAPWPDNRTHSFPGFCNFCITSGSHGMTNHDFINGKTMVVWVGGWMG